MKVNECVFNIVIVVLLGAALAITSVNRNLILNNKTAISDLKQTSLELIRSQVVTNEITIRNQKALIKTQKGLIETMQTVHSMLVRTAPVYLLECLRCHGREG